MNLRQELESIYQRHGKMVAEIVVEEATPVGSPLHSHFEWDDTIAAYEHRLEQARRLIRTVRFHWVTQAGEKKSTRWYHALPNEERAQSYVPLDEITEDLFLRRLLVQQMVRDLESARRRYEHLEEYWKWVAAQKRGRKK